jgi:hypothetical protein
MFLASVIPTTIVRATSLFVTWSGMFALVVETTATATAPLHLRVSQVAGAESARRRMTPCVSTRIPSAMWIKVFA